MNKYRFNIIWSDEDEGYIVTCPEFVGLSAFGDTPEKALKEAKIALELFIQTYQEKGIPLPEPETAQNYSGQIRLRLPKSLHAESARKAREDGISLNQWLCQAAQAKVSGEDVAEKLIRELKREARLVIDKYEYEKSTTTTVERIEILEGFIN
jgi:predicted RNase H-like HicB family nuclease